MRKAIQGAFAVAIVGGGLAFGVGEAFAALGTLRGDPCDDCKAVQWNWCAPSVGGPMFCDDCCKVCGFSGSICLTTAETDKQGCICSG